MDLKPFAKWISAYFAPWGLLMAAATVFQIQEYLLAECIMAASTVGFFWQIWAIPNIRMRRIAVVLMLTMNVYLGYVFYHGKGSRPWATVFSPADQIKVTIDTVFISGPMANTPIYINYPSALGPSTASPVNVLMAIRILNMSPYPVRISSFTADVSDTTAWMSGRIPLIPVELHGPVLLSLV
jgi:hypothetical protein